VAKRKLQKFAELDTFPNVIQPKFNFIEKDFELKGHWNKNFFKNSKPLVLELGCGKGEYTLGLAKKNSEKNFIGIDIKGARIWRGGKTAIDEKITNVGFLRIQIEWIEKYFAENEVDEIWITFPDPQPKKEKKRLTSPIFLEKYRKFLKPNAIIHLKTDHLLLFDYTIETIEKFKHNLLYQTHDLYNSDCVDDILSIQTHYEQLFRNEGYSINYLSFQLNEKNK